MAQDVRFPSDANVRKVPEKKIEEREVKGEPVELVGLHFKKDGCHALDHVHVLVKGVNQVPKHIWEKAKDSPAVKHLLAKDQLEVVADQGAGEADPSKSKKGK
jgi:hypothetical protein